MAWKHAILDIWDFEDYLEYRFYNTECDKKGFLAVRSG